MHVRDPNRPQIYFISLACAACELAAILAWSFLPFFSFYSLTTTGKVQQVMQPIVIVTTEPRIRKKTTLKD